MKIDLAVVTIMKNEAPYVKEWIDYHLLVGVHKFYIYDNESEDNLKEVLQPYIDKGVVEYTFFPGKVQQLPAYNDCLQKHRDDVEWLAVIDADEFIVPVKTKTIQEVLQDYKEYPGLGVNWVLYDSNGHIKKPKGGVLENYTRCQNGYAHLLRKEIKSIVQPSKVVKFVNPHFAVYTNNESAVNEKFIPLTGEKLKPAFSPVSINKIRINHYWSKSYEEMVKKLGRGLADQIGNRKIEECLERCNMLRYTYDYNMYKYVIKLKGNFFKEIIKYLYYNIKAHLDIWNKSDNYMQIYRSNLFNKRWYLKTYPDVKKAKMDPIEHYLNFGWKEGRNPSKNFDTNAYLTAHQDVKKAQMNPLLHYLKYGQKEGRKIFPVKE